MALIITNKAKPRVLFHNWCCGRPASVPPDGAPHPRQCRKCGRRWIVTATQHGPVGAERGHVTMHYELEELVAFTRQDVDRLWKARDEQ